MAVGGYGRGELHPQSDIDLLVLLEGKTERNADEAIGRFLTFLWDIGLEAGHSVRTLDDCEAQARSDVTVLTTLMETRLLHGPGRLFARVARKDRHRSNVDQRGVLSREGRRADRAPQPLPRHRLQPRAERQRQPGGPPRHPDDQLARALGISA